MAVVRAPGRVNLIGDHTDYTGGLVLPMAIDRWTVLQFEPHTQVELSSADETEPVSVPLDIADPSLARPPWGRYVAGVVAEMHPSIGIRGTVSTTIPIGSGLSSSAALEVAVALALGHRGTAVELAELCRRAEIRASGVPCGIMDQLCIAAAVEGHALLIDCAATTVEPVRLPDEVEVEVRFIAHRTLAGSAYADRVAQCAAAEREIGPLRLADERATSAISDPVVRSRARHVVTENQRVRDTVRALADGDLTAVGRLMLESHASLRDRYETSTPEMDAAVESLVATPGVLGARMTGGGFGGCVVALVERGARLDGWRVRPVGAAGPVHDDESASTSASR